MASALEQPQCLLISRRHRRRSHRLTHLSRTHLQPHRTRREPALEHVAGDHPERARPEPRPDWVVTSRRHRHRARHPQDRQGGRRLPGRAAVDPHEPDRAVRDGRQALPRLRPPDLPPRCGLHRGASVKRSRDERALKRKSTWGRARRRGRVGGLRVGRAQASVGAGVPVPYPVQIDGTEILMEWSPTTASTAPRLAQTRPDGRSCWPRTTTRCATSCALLVQDGIVHGDLSAYNMLGRGRAARDHRPAADRGPRRQPATAWTSCCATAPTSAVVQPQGLRSATRSRVRGADGGGVLSGQRRPFAPFRAGSAPSLAGAVPAEVARATRAARSCTGPFFNRPPLP